MEQGYTPGNLMIATKEGSLYDYIANHYYEMSTYDLKEVLLAVLGVGLDNCNSDADEALYSELLVGELESRYFGEE